MAQCNHPSTKSFITDNEDYDVICNVCGVRWKSKTPHVSEESIQADKERFDAYIKKEGEAIIINGDIKVIVFGKNKYGQFKIGIEAPKHITVHREEIQNEGVNGNA